MAESPQPRVLGIETSCDDTACALLDGDGKVLASVVSSQIEAHRPYGGVVPEIASREHLGNWQSVYLKTLSQAGLELEDIDVIAATRGPGLIGCLLVGLSLGRGLAYGLGKPFHAMHHLEGHLFSPFLGASGETAMEAPESFVGLVVSGGHTSLYRVDAKEIVTLAETRDDAMGEAFDKFGKALGLPYPGGPLVDSIAELGTPGNHPLPLASCGPDSLDFSYSGLKSRSLRDLEALRREGVDTTYRSEDPRPFENGLLDLIVGFRAAAVAQLLDRLTRLHREERFGTLAVSGGVAANRLLRHEIDRWSRQRGVDLHLVAPGFSGDNAAMIAHAALLRHRRGQSDDVLRAGAASRLPVTSPF